MVVFVESRVGPVPLQTLLKDHNTLFMKHDERHTVLCSTYQIIQIMEFAPPPTPRIVCFFWPAVADVQRGVGRERAEFGSVRGRGKTARRAPSRSSRAQRALNSSSPSSFKACYARYFFSRS